MTNTKPSEDPRAPRRARGRRIRTGGQKLSLAFLAVSLTVVSGALLTSPVLGGCAPSRSDASADTTFAGLVERLSGPGGFFDTDNLISNERSYLHVVGALEELGVRGGAYLGVGPDQNFSYIARIRPEIAFIVDVRRDNLLQHLLFKALFDRASNRAEFLALWLGRKVPSRRGGWGEASVEELVEAVDGAVANEGSAERAVEAVFAAVEGFGLELSAQDRATIERFHRNFIGKGLDLRFTSHGRPPRPFYPTLRDLILETDEEGRRRNYLARSEDFHFLEELQARDRIIPVVGDLGGGRALEAVGEELRRRDLSVSALYTSNVEFYLMRRNRTFDVFARSVAALPHDEGSVIIRSCFTGCGGVPVRRRRGYGSVQLLQGIEAFVDDWEEGIYRSYGALIQRSRVEAGAGR